MCLREPGEAGQEEQVSSRGLGGSLPVWESRIEKAGLRKSPSISFAKGSSAIHTSEQRVKEAFPCFG